MHLLKLEWLKQKSFRIFQIIAVMYFIALPSILLLVKKIKIPEGELPPSIPTIESFFMFPYVWPILGFIGNWICFFFLGFIGVIMVTNERQNKTMRQNIITGLSRKEYFLSKLYFILAVSGVATLYYVLCCLIFGFIHNDTVYVNTIMKNSDLAYRFFIMATGYMSLGFLIGVLIKRTGIALFLYLAYAAILEPILRWAVHFGFFQHKLGWNAFPESMHYFPINSFEDLVPIPFMEIADEFIRENGFDFMLSPSTAMIISLIYIALFWQWSFWKLKSSDL